MSKFLFQFLSLCFVANGAIAQILVEQDGGIDAGTSQGRIADDAIDLRQKRKVGIGFSALGASGVGGLMAEINFTADTGLAGGFGFGPQYQTFDFEVKHVFGGTWFAPYVAGGYAHWYSTSNQGQIQSTQPSFLGRRFLSSAQIRNGDIHENILFPSLGMQYMQLTGDYAGTSVFVEIVGLLDVNAVVFVPTASFGALYYF